MPATQKGGKSMKGGKPMKGGKVMKGGMFGMNNNFACIKKIWKKINKKVKYNLFLCVVRVPSFGMIFSHLLHVIYTKLRHFLLRAHSHNVS